MPKNKQESLIFGVIMCFGMVAVMASYNLLLNGDMEHLSMQTVLTEFGLGFIVALVLDLFIVGPLAKKITFALPFKKDKKIKVVLVLSSMMIVGMVFFMSLFGLAMTYFAHGLSGETWLVLYGAIYVKNFIVALPLQLIVMGPLVRYIFTNFIQKNNLQTN
ncbi:DUF2798 domain-containing protein [Gracilibacillus sp. S3-1-1]|uniref:DUF2798 domain-containing protein n=1 Tax=Gracilibacillus pellucidus TaxID=3095368 RepID=A0ACC6M762_9BACI|nr:DUF2798 domain-containing protein [Gracilibacillus sp. S3-1-1]MDX8046602.1 DUF2798 domain-containing protein [Gracilibacillus sp. S3-1-1]